MSSVLTVVDGGREPRRGVDVLDELVALIETRLPDVATDDPVRPHLESFHRAAAPLERVLRVRPVS